eukprot:scaffold160632_cov39-Tisochrysis_lutea.AAC.2
MVGGAVRACSTIRVRVRCAPRASPAPACARSRATYVSASGEKPSSPINAICRCAVSSGVVGRTSTASFCSQRRRVFGRSARERAREAHAEMYAL